MDSRTLRYYREHAAEVAARYASAAEGVDRYFRDAFAPGMYVLDVGAGSGRDLARLLKMGVEAYGVEPCEELRAEAVKRYPQLEGRLRHGVLPELGQPFGRDFDGVLCSAVLMHLPRNRVPDAALALRRVLTQCGVLLLSVPLTRPGIGPDDRDENGRLYTPLSEQWLVLLFKYLGFELAKRWYTDDASAREGVTWCTLLLRRRRQDSLRPVDQVESILYQDRKTATYKLALLRALTDIALTGFGMARWYNDGTVGVALDDVAHRWLLYYWPLVESSTFIPQMRGEARNSARNLLFRPALSELADFYRQAGGLRRFLDQYRSETLPSEAQRLLDAALDGIRKAIVDGPVAHAGRSMRGPRVFSYDHRHDEITMSAGMWCDLSRFGRSIQHAAIEVWAELTAEFSNGTIRPSEVLDLLLTTPAAGAQ